MHCAAKLKFSKGIAARMLADALMVNFALSGALLLRLLARVVWQQQPASTLLVHSLFRFYAWSAPLLALLTAGVFYRLGIYTHARFYSKRYKAFLLSRAISAVYLFFVLLWYGSGKGSFDDLWTVAAAYGATLLLCGGTRLLINLAGQRYRIVERNASRRGPLRRVLVAGGAGYLGSVLTRRLLNEGYPVRVLDTAMFGEGAISDLIGHPRFEWVQGDLRHVESLVRAVKGCDAVIHLGAIVGDPACELNEKAARDVNTFATRLLVQVAKGYGVRRLLFASTCAVYGASGQPVNEQSPLHPVSVYAQSKADAEALLLASQAEDFCPVALRLGTLFGQSYRPRFDLLVNLLVAKAWHSGRITIFNREQWRPFVHVDDAARAFVACLQAGVAAVRGQIFNVGADHLNLTLGQLAEKIRAEMPGTAVEYRKKGDVRNYRVCCEKIRANLLFSCEKTIEDGIREVRSYLACQSAEVLTGDSFDNSKRWRALLDGGWAAQAESLPLESVSSAAGPA